MVGSCLRRGQLDDFAIALYVDIDDALDPLALRRGAGRPVQISDSELVCLAALQVLLGINSERRWLRVARQRLGHLFPRLPDQSTYNRRLRAAGGMLAHAIGDLGRAHSFLARPDPASGLDPGAVRELW